MYLGAHRSRHGGQPRFEHLQLVNSPLEGVSDEANLGIIVKTLTVEVLGCIPPLAEGHNDLAVGADETRPEVGLNDVVRVFGRGQEEKFLSQAMVVSMKGHLE